MGFNEARIATRAASGSDSVTLAITAKANIMRQEGLDVINLAAGEPDFNTPSFVIDAAIKAMNEGKTKYTPAIGLPILRQQIAEKLKNDNGLHYTASDIVVGVGAKHVLFNIFQAVVNPGDEILLPSPCWISYEEMASLAGGKSVLVPTDYEDGYAIHRDRLEAALTPKSKIIVLNSPANPTGAVYTRETLQMVADFAIKNDLLVISDEIYEKMLYSDIGHISIGSLSPEIFARTLTVNGLSKSHSMTGWRIGYVAGPSDVLKAIGMIQSHSTSNAVTFCQWASISALQDTSDFMDKNKETYRKRRDYMYEELTAIEGIRCAKPGGAFYLFPDVSYYYGKVLKGKLITSSLDFCSHLLDTEHIAAVPGGPFGDDRCIRISYATSEKDLERAIERLKNFLRG